MSCRLGFLLLPLFHPLLKGITMSLLNAVVSKFFVATGVAQEVYVCPGDKTHAIVDLSFLKDDESTTSLIGVALTTESNSAALTTVDYMVDDLELIGAANSAELNKVIVGSGERLFVKVLSGTGVSVRVSGVEENNVKVAKAGRLAATSVAGTAQTTLFSTALPNVAYVSASVTAFNTSAVTPAAVEMWISSEATPTGADKVMNLTISPNDTTIVENILLKPAEKVFVRSNTSNTEYFVVGCVTLI